ncbi:MAG: YidH family protein [Methylocystis sp.]
MTTNDQPKADGSRRFETHVTAESHFSWMRTRLSIERTLMSWVRTATALIGFGFTIVQFFERLNTTENVVPPTWPGLSKIVGLALIGTGVLALAIALWQYLAVTNYLWGPQFEPIAGVRVNVPRSPLLLVTVILIFIGLFALVSIAARAI